MRPFILTDLQAGKLPRWGLLLLCALYALPGLVGRDAWREDDAAGFGVALAMIRGGPSDWLMPNVVGEPFLEGGPLSFWLAALPARVLGVLPAHAVVCAVALLLLALMFVAFWYASYAMAKRPGVQPSDPFGASASHVDYGRAVADSALLLLLATFGLVARLHETTAAAAQVTVVAGYLLGAGLALDHPRRGGTLAGIAIGASLLTRGVAPFLALAACTLALPILIRQYRLIVRHFLSTALVAAAAISVAWPLGLMLHGGDAAAFANAWIGHAAASMSGPSSRGIGYLLRTAPWFFWPAWPIAAWALLRWRSRLREPAVAVPLAALIALLVPALLAPAGEEANLMPLAPPLAMLAAVGLPTLRRTVVSLIDWFSVMTFTVFGVVSWAYWIALITGYPPTMAYKAGQLAPGFRPEWIVDEIVLGVAATLAWLLLVRWRVSRQRPMIWRAVVLSSGGLVLAWFLLMTLWLPVFNERNTYRDLSLRTAQALPAGYDCVATRNVGLTERTSLAYFGHIRFGAPERCGWLLIEDNGPIARVISPEETGWHMVWQGSRPRDPDERLRLYRRAG